MAASRYDVLWRNIQSNLNNGMPNWKARITSLGQIPEIEAREKGKIFSDHEVFAGIVKAVLSNSTDWSKIERVSSKLREVFHDFDVTWYSELPPSHVADVLVPWFRMEKAGSVTMRRDFASLITSAKKLTAHSKEHNGLHNYFEHLRRLAGSDTVRLAEAIGSTRSSSKLPALGIPIAAEALKNIGYDVAKPDRHINRAMAALELYKFRKWEDSEGTGSPSANEKDLLRVMYKIKELADDLHERVALLDNAIWLLCAKGGMHYSNRALRLLNERTV